jgi:hypothetical protein
VALLQLVVYDESESSLPTPTRTWNAVALAAASDVELVKAVAMLRRILREDWKGWGNGSPLANQFGMSLQSGAPEWVRLCQLIGLLEHARGIEALVRKELGSSVWTQYVAAIMALEFCGRFAAMGNSVHFIETCGDEAPADAFVDVAGREIRVEFKALHEAESSEKWNDLVQWVCQRLAKQGADNEIDVDCSPLALERREALLRDLLAVRSAKPNGTVELPSGAGRATYTGLNVMGWRFPEKQRPDVERLYSKLTTRWWKKFRSPDRPSLLVVRTSMLFGQSCAGIEARAQAVGEALTAALPGLVGLSAVIVYDDPFLPPIPSTHSTVVGARLSTGAMDGCARVIFLVTNPDAVYPLTDKEVDRLSGPGMVW